MRSQLFEILSSVQFPASWFSSNRKRKTTKRTSGQQYHEVVRESKEISQIVHSR